MRQFEYKVETVSLEDRNVALNESGKGGWELVAVTTPSAFDLDSLADLYFKRELF